MVSTNANRRGKYKLALTIADILRYRLIHWPAIRGVKIEYNIMLENVKS